MPGRHCRRRPRDSAGDAAEEEPTRSALATLHVVDDDTTMTLLLFPQTYAAIPPGVLSPHVLVEFEARVLKGENGPALVPHGEWRPITD